MVITQNFPEQKEMTKDDYVIICGDFGGIWSVDALNREERWLLDWLEEKPFTTLFVDGNHEYFEEIRQNVQFTKWFFGYYHDNRNVNAKEILLYEQVIRIA